MSVVIVVILTVEYPSQRCNDVPFAYVHLKMLRSSSMHFHEELII